jgi:hypothetical protein
MSGMELFELWELGQIALHVLMGQALLVLACVFVVVEIVDRVVRSKRGE